MRWNLRGIFGQKNADPVVHAQPEYCLETVQSLRVSVPRPDQPKNFRSFFEHLADAVRIDEKVERTPSGRMASAASAVELSEECGDQVYKIFKQFFEQDGWKDAGDVQKAWKRDVPDELKKLVFSTSDIDAEDGYHASPATIYRHAESALRHQSRENDYGDLYAVPAAA